MKPYVMPNGKLSTVRVSVYDVYYWSVNGFSNEQNMIFNCITAEELHVALDYIQAHRDEVEAVHQQIEERNARGNSPEVRARIELSRVRFEEYVREIRKRTASNGAIHDPQGTTCGLQCGGASGTDSRADLDESWMAGNMAIYREAYQNSLRNRFGPDYPGLTDLGYLPA